MGDRKGRPYARCTVVGDTVVLFLSFLADGYEFDADVFRSAAAVFVGAEAVYRQNAPFVRDDGDGGPLPLGELAVDEPLF